MVVAWGPLTSCSWIYTCHMSVRSHSPARHPPLEIHGTFLYERFIQGPPAAPGRWTRWQQTKPPRLMDTSQRQSILHLHGHIVQALLGCTEQGPHVQRGRTLFFTSTITCIKSEMTVEKCSASQQLHDWCTHFSTAVDSLATLRGDVGKLL